MKKNLYSHWVFDLKGNFTCHYHMINIVQNLVAFLSHIFSSTLLSWYLLKIQEQKGSHISIISQKEFQCHLSLLINCASLMPKHLHAIYFKKLLQFEQIDIVQIKEKSIKIYIKFFYYFISLKYTVFRTFYSMKSGLFVVVLCFTSRNIRSLCMIIL